MKKFLLLNFTGIFLFFVIACMFISCGKSSATKEESGEDNKPTEPKNVATKFTPQMAKEAIEYFAKKLPEEEREDFLEDSPLNDPDQLNRWVEKINTGVSEGKLKVAEFSGKALGEALFQAEGGEKGIGKARNKRNQLICASQLGQIAKAFISFSSEYGALPWHLYDEEEKKMVFGEGNPEHLGTIFALEGIRQELGSPKVLISPCDPDRKAIAAFKGYNARKNKPIPHKSISYGLCSGGDDQLPDTILGITRNVSGDDLKGATFVGDVMKGLEAGQGNLAMSDGSVSQHREGGAGELAEKTKKHLKEVGGNAVGPPSTKLWLPK